MDPFRPQGEELRLVLRALGATRHEPQSVSVPPATVKRWWRLGLVSRFSIWFTACILYIYIYILHNHYSYQKSCYMCNKWYLLWYLVFSCSFASRNNSLISRRHRRKNLCTAQNKMATWSYPRRFNEELLNCSEALSPLLCLYIYMLGSTPPSEGSLSIFPANKNKTKVRVCNSC